MVENAQMFIVDECQFIAADSIQLITKASKNAKYKLGFSGTPWRDDGADLALTAATGPQLIDINATALIGTKVLVPPKIFFFEVPELPGLEKHQKHPYQKVYDTYVVENQTRNEMIIESATKLHAKGRKTLILVKRKKHGMKLLEMMPKHLRVYYLNGDAPSEERQAVKDLFSMGGLDVIIASSIFDQGIDLPTLDALILAGSGKSSTRALQRVGRVIRGADGKRDAIVVDFIDCAPYLFDHSRRRHTIYKTEPGFQIKLPEAVEW
jgi:superfamily II DNA or RNA helicase